MVIELRFRHQDQGAFVPETGGGAHRQGQPNHPEKSTRKTGHRRSAATIIGTGRGKGHR